ncbi:MAG: methyl-accepting chemotaxis protein [Zoogloea sp.]|nr:methyl-accepting chemotaxis protein [Zoogloea sp.]
MRSGGRRGAQTGRTHRQLHREISVTVSEVQGEADRVVAMIKGVTSEVREGVQFATDSGSVLDSIRNESNRTTSAVNDIADAMREQSAASQDVARGVERIAQMAEQNNRITRHTHGQTAVLEQPPPTWNPGQPLPGLRRLIPASPSIGAGPALFWNTGFREA